MLLIVTLLICLSATKEDKNGSHKRKCEPKNTNDEKIITLSQLNSYLKSATKVITFF